MTSTQKYLRTREAGHHVKVGPQDNIPKSVPIDKEAAAQKMKRAKEIADRLGMCVKKPAKPAATPGQLEASTTVQGSADHAAGATKAAEQPKSQQTAADEGSSTKSPKLKDIQGSLKTASVPPPAVNKPKEPTIVAPKTAEKAPEVASGPRRVESAASTNRSARSVNGQAPAKEATRSRIPVGHNGLIRDNLQCYQNATYQNLANLPGLVQHLESLEWAQRDPDADPNLKPPQTKGKSRAATSEKELYRKKLDSVKSSL